MFPGANQMMPQGLWKNGPMPGQFYNFGAGSNQACNTAQGLCKEYTTPGEYGTQHASKPITTGSTVVGLKFDGGVMIAADNLISYGSMARYQDVQRVFKVNDITVMGTGGDYADFQNIQRTIEQRVIDDECRQDSLAYSPKALYNWLTHIFYGRRSRMNPLWLEMVVGGLENGKPYLGHIDLRGRAYEDNVIATGFGAYLALPLMREKLPTDRLFTQEEASELIRKCMEVLYYRDCRAMSKYTVAVCTKDGSVVQGPFKVNENWDVAKFVKGY